MTRRGRGWQGAYRDDRRRERTKTFATKREAELWISQMESDVSRGLWIDPAAGKVTFRAYAEEWREIQVHRPKTADTVETYLRRHVYPRIGDRQLGQVRRSEIQALVKTMGELLAPGSVQLAYSFVASIFKAAVADRLIPSSPCVDIRLPNIDGSTVVPLATETIEALVSGFPPRYRALVVLGAGTGVRLSEALGVTSDRIDWPRRLVTVNRQLADIRGGLPIFGPVKDRKNRPRTIPLPEVVVAALVEHVRAFGLGSDGLVFTNERGKPIWRTTFSNFWMAAAGPLGIPKGDGYHQLRHYYASLLIHHGESVKVVQERLGHATATMTLDTYGHLWPNSEDKTRAAVDDVLSVKLNLEGVA